MLLVPSVSPACQEAVALLFARDYNLQSLAVLHWRHARIELLSRIALLAGGQTSPIGHDDALAALQNQYRIGSLLIDFFPEILWTASLSNRSGSGVQITFRQLHNSRTTLTAITI